MSDRRPIFAGNWKMHLLAADARAYCATLRRELSSEAEVLLFPSFTLLRGVAAELEGQGVEVGAQDVHPETRGAHTGDVSAAQLLDAGCRWVICGHSERRRDHHETEAEVAGKLAAASASGLRAILCLGESLEERDGGATFRALDRQLEPALSSLETHHVLAYEPVWAIGTGRSATPEAAQEVHAFLRRRLEESLGPEAAHAIRLLYGGSVKVDNCASLFEQTEIDGFLIGGASLDPNSFLSIIVRCSPG